MDQATTVGAPIASATSRAIGINRLGSLLITALIIMQALLLLFLGNFLLAALITTAGFLLAYAAGSVRFARWTGQVSWKLFGTCMVIALAIYALGGEGRFFYANTDWQVRNAVLRDLTLYPWPFIYSDGGEEQILRAPLGMYLLPALVGKVIGFHGAELALWLQNSMLLATLLAIGSTLYQTCRRRWLTLLVFFGFSGMDVLGQLIAGQPLWLHLEQWAGIQYTGHLTQAFWVPQHALAGWMFALFYLLWREARVAAWVPLATVPLVAILSPLALMGMIPFAAHIGIETAAKRRLLWLDFALPAIATAITIPTLLYLTAASDAVGSRAAVPDLSVYTTFIALELGAFLFALWQVRERLRYGKVTMALTVGVLLLAPFGKVGDAVDFVMRASIPALAILSLAVAEIATRTPTSDDKAGGRARTWALMALAIGLFTPAGEIARAILLPRAPAQLCGYFGVVPHGYDTYVAPVNRLPTAVRPVSASVIVPSDPAECWSNPWPDAAKDLTP